MRRRATGEQRLRGVEDVRADDADAVGLQAAHGAERLLDERQLHDDLVGELRELRAVTIRARCVERVDRGEDRVREPGGRARARCARRLGVRVVGEQARAT